MQEAILYKKITGGVECSACSWRCKIAEGKSGVCGMRQNIGDKLFLLVFGRASAVNIDPMEKKPLYHFLPGKKIFSIGTVGCNFSCKFCQNFDISQSEYEGKTKDDIKTKSGALSPEEAAKFCISHRLPAVAFTYNEPAIWAEYARDIMKLLKPRGVKGVFVTNGYETPEALDFLGPYIDAYNIDLKGFSEKYYAEVCGARLAPVLETIKEVWRRGKWLEVTTLIVPGENDSDEELRAVAEFIAGVSTDIPWHLSAFFPTYLMSDRAPTPDKTLLRAYRIGREAGLKYVYLGNTNDLEHSATYCPRCNKKVISREGFELTKFELKDGHCPKCAEPIAGVWK
jgi:pyruvate formate lyase activating enzyme